jgi:curved DNA-binding protein CbpA
MLKNYYQILDLSPDATKEEIKKAYKLFVSKFHPDKHENDSFFNARFLEIQEAYNILSNDETREEYDSLLFNEIYEEEERETQQNEPNVKLSVSENIIKFGDSVKFIWETENISELTIVGHGSYPVNGSVTFTPTKNTDYVFLFSNHKTTIKKEITINVSRKTASIYLLLIFIPALIFILWKNNSQNYSSQDYSSQDFTYNYSADSIAAIDSIAALLPTIESTTTAQTDSKSVDNQLDNSLTQPSSDIAQVVNTFISNNKDGVVAWNIFKDNSELQRYDDNLEIGEISSYQLRFSSALTINGKPIFMNEVGDDGEWGISLHGARVGAFILLIETFFYYTDPMETLKYLSTKLSMEQILTEYNSSSVFSAIYIAKGSYIKYYYSMGASGCGSLYIYVSKDLEDIRNL